VQAKTNARRPPVKIGRCLYAYEYVYNGEKKTSYYADVKIDSRQKRIKLVASTRGEARKAQAELVSKLGRNELSTPSKATVREVGEEWLRTLDVKPRTREAYEYHLRLNIYPQLGTRKVQDIRPQDAADLVAWLRDVRKVGGETATGAVRTLSGLLAHATWEGLIPSNPVAVLPKGKRPKRQHEEHRYLSTGERDLLLEAMTATYKPVAYVAVWSGLRENELLGLTWADIDLNGKKIHVRKQLSRPTKDHPAERVSIKTGTTRSVDIDPELVAFLREHRAQAFALGHAKQTDYVFCAESGRPLHFRNLGKAFTKAADKSKLNTDEKRKLRFHDLRRTFASILIEGGCEGPYVAQQLGHSVAVLYSTYAGLLNARSQSEKGLAAIQKARGQS
jgi:integrase